jgi:adenine phosphoribosyltransferase
VTLQERILAASRDVMDFPREGIVFKDLAGVYADHQLFADVRDALLPSAQGATVVAGIEARGFLVGAALSLAAGVGFVPIRKAGKLPGRCRSLSYELEYGCATLEVQTQGLNPGDRVLVVDDVLATGGTAAAACRLIESCGAQVTGLAILVELSSLGGREQLAGRALTALATA